MIKKLLISLCLFFLSLNGDDGALLFYGNCATCHHETQAISAPSMFEVQQYYKNAFENKEDFIEYMSQFVTQPRLDNALMVMKVQKYKLMPILGYEKSVIKDIVTYIYDRDFTQ